MKDRRAALHVLVLLVSSVLLADQFLFHREERSIYLDSTVLREEHPSVSYSRWRRWNYKPGPVLTLHTYSYWYVEHLANGRWFQLKSGDNGVLQHGDSVDVVVACISGRVLSFAPLDDGSTRTTADACEDLVPFLFLLAPLSLWLLAGASGADGRYYLHFLLIVIGLSFLIALFATTFPLMRALDMVPMA